MTPHERMGQVYRQSREVDPTGRLGDALWVAALGDGYDEEPGPRADRMELLWRALLGIWRARGEVI